jgi:mono/diheme cytochrome c family protein
VTYRVYCQNCHGADAKGQGHLASLMKVQPADLTQISKKHGGTFPSEDVHKAIDGREEVLAHGDREMPIWGQALTGNDEEVQRKIQQLVAYLESIQEKGGTAKKGS